MYMCGGSAAEGAVRTVIAVDMPRVVCAVVEELFAW